MTGLGTYSQACTTCNSEPVRADRSTAARAAKTASGEPSVASRIAILVRGIPAISSPLAEPTRAGGSTFQHDELILRAPLEQAPFVRFVTANSRFYFDVSETSHEPLRPIPFPCSHWRGRPSLVDLGPGRSLGALRAASRLRQSSMWSSLLCTTLSTVDPPRPPIAEPLQLVTPRSHSVISLVFALFHGASPGYWVVVYLRLKLSGRWSSVLIKVAIHLVGIDQVEAGTSSPAQITAFVNSDGRHRRRIRRVSPRGILTRWGLLFTRAFRRRATIL